MSAPRLQDRQASSLSNWLPPFAFLLTGLATLDPSLRPAASLILALSVAAWTLARPSGARASGGAWLLLAGMLAAAAPFQQLFGADSVSYLVYARSLLFDRDLDFTNEYTSWGVTNLTRTVTGHVANVHPVGSALVWTPFVLAAHAYVRLTQWLGVPLAEADGFGEPYLRATLLGTLTVAGFGAVRLWRALARRFTRAEAACGLAAAVFCSPVPYYLVLSPAMAHGVEFGVACLFLAAWLDSRDTPGLRPWLVLGALWGLLTLVRWQAAVFGVFLVAFALARRSEGPARLCRGLAAAAAALVVFAPQMLVWHALYGKWLTTPQGPGFVDWSSPRFLSVLVSADRGLFNWHPVMLAGAIGLLLVLLRASLRWFAAAGVAAVVATAWVNGGVADWSASDAFGGRRFVLVVPLLAVGVAEATRRLTGTVARRPWLIVAGVIGLAAAWNASLIGLYRIRAIDTAPAPLERVAALQTQRLREVLEGAALRLGGPTLRNRVYEVFVGEYFYENVNPAGIINVGRPESPYLEEGWSRARQHLGWPNFRWAFYPKACVRFALRDPFPLWTTLSARAPDGLTDQVVTITVNEVPVHSEPLSNEWTDIRFLIPERPLVPGPNRLCLAFKTVPPDSDGGPVAAAVSVIQLP